MNSAIRIHNFKPLTYTVSENEFCDRQTDRGVERTGFRHINETLKRKWHGSTGKKNFYARHFKIYWILLQFNDL